MTKAHATDLDEIITALESEAFFALRTRDTARRADVNQRLKLARLTRRLGSYALAKTTLAMEAAR